jgi:hypothetical protein
MAQTEMDASFAGVNDGADRGELDGSFWYLSNDSSA